MELNVTNEQKNPLYNRTEIFGSIKEKNIPSKMEVANLVAEKYSVPSTAVRILEIKGKFGLNEFFVRANIYTSQEERDKIERMSKKEKEQETKANEKPAEETKEETPSENAGAPSEPVAEAPKEEAPTENAEVTTEEKPAEPKQEEAPVEAAEEKPAEEIKEEKVEANAS